LFHVHPALQQPEVWVAVGMKRDQLAVDDQRPAVRGIGER